MALIAASAPLTRELQRLLPSRPFHVRFWDGHAVAATQPDAPTFFVRRPSALAHFLRAPGSLGLGRAYVDGSLVVDDLDAAFIVVDDVGAAGDRGAAIGCAWAAAIAAAAAPGGIPRRPEPRAAPATASSTASSATPPPCATTTTSETTSSRCSSTSR